MVWVSRDLERKLERVMEQYEGVTVDDLTADPKARTNGDSDERRSDSRRR